MLIDEAHAVRLERRNHRIDSIDLVAEVMQPLAVPSQELRDEPLVTRQFLDELDRDAAQVEVLPEEAALCLFADLLFVARLSREVTLEELHSAIDGRHRD